MNNPSKKTVAIFTNFMDFNPGYSLSGIVVDQALMLLRHGHKVYIYVNESFNPKYNQDARVEFLEETFPDQFEIRRKTKFMHLVDYKTKANLSAEHKEEATEAAKIFAEEIIQNKIQSIYTHDFIFTGWNLPYAEAIKECSKIVAGANHLCYFFHWIHSVPSAGSDWWRLNEYGDNHLIVFPNNTEIQRIAEQFQTTTGRIRIIPHIKDLRTWYDFGGDALLFTDMYPEMMSSEIVKVYPVSTDRMSAKQLQVVIQIFAHLKSTQISVFLCIANQWATGRQNKESVHEYIKMGEELGLVYGKDFVFTSEVEVPVASEDKIPDQTSGVQVIPIKRKPFETGISRRMLRELQLLSSVFIFPTKEESFGLVGPEAALSGCLCVINRSLTMQYEVMGRMAPAFDFGSHHQNHPPTSDPNYIKAVSMAILNRIFINESVMTKIYCRQRYNMDALYHRNYLPMTL